MKHTPGPWRATISKGDLKHGGYPDKCISFVIDSDTRKLMAMGECWNTFSDDPNPFPEIEANARLIAAAPEMLDALKSLYEHCAMIHKTWGDGCNQKQADAAIIAGHAAIAKAEGR